MGALGLSDLMSYLLKFWETNNTHHPYIGITILVFYHAMSLNWQEKAQFKFKLVNGIKR